MTLTTLRRALVEKRLGLAVVLVLVLGATGVWTAGVYPLARRVDTARVRAATAARTLTEATAARNEAQALRDATQRARAELDEFYDDVLPVDLRAARGIAYSRLSELTRQHRLVMERRSVVRETLEEERLVRLDTTMLLAGAWSDLRRFMHALETSDEFLVIEGIVLGGSDTSDGSLTITLNVATYYRTT